MCMKLESMIDFSYFETRYLTLFVTVMCHFPRGAVKKVLLFYLGTLPTPSRHLNTMPTLCKSHQLDARNDTNKAKLEFSWYKVIEA